MMRSKKILLIFLKISKKVQKTLGKGLDKGGVMWYNNEVAAQKGRRNDP